MAWITNAYVGRAIGTVQCTRLGFDDATTFAQLEAAARARVVAVLQHAGYASPGSTLVSGSDAEAFLQKVTMAVMVREAYADKKGIQLPVQVNDAYTDLGLVYAKKLPVPGMSPDTLDGIGGVKGSPISTASTDARPAVFGRSRMTGF